MPEIPHFLRKPIYTNGQVREDHAPKSVLFRPCSSEFCNGERREYQIANIDTSRGISVFRCVICDTRIQVSQSSAQVEEKEKGVK